MNDLTLTGNTLTMTSREIADLTDKQHKNVIRDIRVMLIELFSEKAIDEIVPEQHRNRHTEYIRENAGSIMERLFGDGADRSHAQTRGFSWERDTRGYVALFRLSRELTETLITGYSIPLRHKVIRRLHELERHAAPSLSVAPPQSFAAALRLAADQAELLERQQAELAEAAPKVEALDRIAGSRGAMCITDAAKHLQVPPRRLFDWLKENRWIYQRPGSTRWVGYQPRIQSGFILHKITTISADEQGELRAATQVRITPKGLAKLALLVGESL